MSLSQELECHWGPVPPSLYLPNPPILDVIFMGTCTPPPPALLNNVLYRLKGSCWEAPLLITHIHTHPTHTPHTHNTPHTNTPDTYPTPIIQNIRSYDMYVHIRSGYHCTPSNHFTSNHFYSNRKYIFYSRTFTCE
jgi:hypothetical protein